MASPCAYGMPTATVFDEDDVTGAVCRRARHDPRELRRLAVATHLDADNEP